MEFALKNFKNYDENQLVDIIHEYPEWEQFKARFYNQGGREDNIDIAKILDDPKENDTFKENKFKDPFKPLTDSEKKLLLDGLADYICESL